MTRLVVFLVAMLGALPGSSLGSPCYPLDNRTAIELTGRVLLRTYPGPPNYESIADGDAPEQQLILVLEQPICADGPGMTGTEEEPLHVPRAREVTLVPSAKVPRVRPAGRRYTVSGILFEAHTAHHRTDLLLDLESARPATR